MSSEDAHATVAGFMRALVEERIADAHRLLHEDFVVYEAGGVPYSGEYRGPRGFFELFEKMNEDMELTPDPAVQYLLADDTVALRYRLKFMGLVEIYTVRDGLIVEDDVYYKDPSAVAALLAV